RKASGSDTRPATEAAPAAGNADKDALRKAPARPRPGPTSPRFPRIFSVFPASSQVTGPCVRRPPLSRGAPRPPVPSSAAGEWRHDEHESTARTRCPPLLGRALEGWPDRLGRRHGLDEPAG